MIVSHDLKQTLTTLLGMKWWSANGIQIVDGICMRSHSCCVIFRRGAAILMAEITGQLAAGMN